MNLSAMEQGHSQGLTVGCIGAGYFSRFHYDGWRQMGDARLVASVDLDLARAEATGLAAYASVEAMLDAGVPDIIDIITPPDSHLAMIRTVLAARPRAVICQKPFCTGLDEAREAARLSEAAGVPLIVHENFRFQPWYRTIKAAITAGRIGTPMQATFRFRPGDGQGPGAYLDRQPYFQRMERFLVHETAVHWIDTFRFLMGAPTGVFADLRRLNPAIAGEDAGHILLAYEGGGRALFDGNRHLDHAATNPRCTMGEGLFEGTEGALTLLGDGSVHLRAAHGLDQVELLGPNTDAGFGGDCARHLQAHVVAGLQGECAFENTAADYLEVLATEAAVYASAVSGAWVRPDL